MVPPRFELGLLDSKSRVLTVTLWNLHMQLVRVLRGGNPKLNIMKVSRNNFQKNRVPNMDMKSIREKVEKVKPHLLKVVSDTFQGYAFGCMVGVFSSDKKPTLRSIHESGKSFAKVSLIYSTTESGLQLYGSENTPLNSFVSGAVAGGLGVNDKSKRTIFTGAASFGLYTGMSSAFSVKGQK